MQPVRNQVQPECNQVHPNQQRATPLQPECNQVQPNAYPFPDLFELGDKCLSLFTFASSTSFPMVASISSTILLLYRAAAKKKQMSG